MTGRVHSVQSLGAVDGPGLRSVVFLQGCPLRCAYCHNPDTWDFSGGTEMKPEELLKRLLRFRPYWGKKFRPGESYEGGGVTVSGGEPLMQADFTAELFKKLHDFGIHTALDTSGAGDLKTAGKVLKETDLVLLDVKFLTEKEYRRHCGGSFERMQAFLDLTGELGIPVRLRHVAVPGLTADETYMKAVKTFADSVPNLEKLEFLPFHNLCMEKYDRPGIPFLLKDTKVMEPGEWNKLLEKIK